MPVLAEASKILSTSIGSIVYHLLLMWAVASSLGMAQGERQRTPYGRTQRLLLGMGGLAVVRGIYVAAAFAVAGGWIDQIVLLPPLERVVDAASIALWAWAFIPPSRAGSRTWNLSLGSVLALTFGGCIVSTAMWAQMLAVNPALSYNGTAQAMIWSAWQALLALVGVAAVVYSRPQSWGLLVSALVLMLLGALSPWYLPIAVPHLPTWHRLANLVAYPLATAAVYREIVAGLDVHSRELQDLSQASLDQIKSLLYLFEASRQTASSLELSTVLDNAVRGIARVLEADQCAIALPEEGNSGQMRLVAIHNPSRQGRGEVVSFPLEYQLTVQQAIRRKRGIVVEESDNVQLKVLFALLGSAEAGPLLVQPLLEGDEAIGAIIAGNSRSHRLFSANEAKLCQSLAEQVVGAIQNARRYQRVHQRMQELARIQSDEIGGLQQARAQVQEYTDRLAKAGAEIEGLQQLEEAANEARNALEIELVRTRAENETLSQRLAQLKTDLIQAEADLASQMRGGEQALVRGTTGEPGMAREGDSFQDLIEGLTAGILITDSRGAIWESNAAAGLLLGCTVEALRGLDLAAVSGDGRWQQAVRAAHAGEAVRLTMHMGMNALLCEVAPWPGPEGDNGDRPRLVAILQDVSAEAEAQRQRLEAIGSLAEELRTPLTTISSYTDLLLSETVGILGETQRKFLVNVKSGAERIAQVAGLLTHKARTEEVQGSLQRQIVDVNKLIEATIAGTHNQLEDRKLKLTLEMQEDLPPVAADPDYLRRILTDLLSNAYLASKVGGRVGVRTAQLSSPPVDQGLELNGDSFVIVSITSSGGGLPDEALGQGFEQSGPDRASAGLGEARADLPLVETLVEAHGGRLWVENNRGKGTTYSFALPVDNSGDPGHESNSSGLG